MQTGISIQTARLCALNIIIKPAGINLIPAGVLHAIPKVQKEPDHNINDVAREILPIF